jgi:hypothetical protein
MEGEILTKRYFALQVKCPSLSADLKKNFTVSSPCAESSRYDISVTSHQVKARHRQKSTLLSK